MGLEEARTEVLNMLEELHAGVMFSGRRGRNSVNGDMHGGYELGGGEDEEGAEALHCILVVPDVLSVSDLDVDDAENSAADGGDRDEVGRRRRGQ
jgi:hypothetical protein